MIALIIFTVVWLGLHYGLVWGIFRLKSEFGDPWPTVLFLTIVITLGMVLYMDSILCRIAYDLYTFEQVSEN